MPELLHVVTTAYQKATFGMGCFWSCDSLYGGTKGVLRTCVGYAGGTSRNPEYRNLGDHTEVIEVHFDPKCISYERLLELFWENHEYGLTTKVKRQYMSLILYHNEEQKIAAKNSMTQKAEEIREPLRTEIAQAGLFYPAENYHQKYRLQGHSWLSKQIGLTADKLQTSYLAAKLNGYLGGVGTMEQFNEEAQQLGLSEKMTEYMRREIDSDIGRSLSCG